MPPQQKQTTTPAPATQAAKQAAKQDAKQDANHLRDVPFFSWEGIKRYVQFFAMFFAIKYFATKMNPSAWRRAPAARESPAARMRIHTTTPFDMPLASVHSFTQYAAPHAYAFEALADCVARITSSTVGLDADLHITFSADGIQEFAEDPYTRCLLPHFDLFKDPAANMWHYRVSYLLPGAKDPVSGILNNAGIRSAFKQTDTYAPSHTSAVFIAQPNDLTGGALLLQLEDAHRHPGTTNIARNRKVSEIPFTDEISIRPAVGDLVIFRGDAHVSQKPFRSKHPAEPKIVLFFEQYQIPATNLPATATRFYFGEAQPVIFESIYEDITDFIRYALSFIP